MTTPYITLGGVNISYTKDEYERHGRKIFSEIQVLTGRKRFFYLQNKDANTVDKYRFSLRTAIIEDYFDMQKLFSIKGSLFLIDYTPIVEMKEGSDKNFYFLNRIPYEDISAVKVELSNGTTYTPVFENSDTPNAGEVNIYTDGSRKIVFPVSIPSGTNIFIQYIPQFEVKMQEDPLIKWVKDEIYYLQINLEEV